MKETDIRPSELIKGQEKAFQHDIKCLLKHEKEYDFINCPVCNLDICGRRFIKQGHQFVVCGECGTIYINPRPTPQLLADYYSNSEHYKYWASKIFPQTEQKRREQIFKPRAQKVSELAIEYLSIRKHSGYYSLLEVGAGYGTFCEEIKKLNVFKDIYAVEPTQELARTCVMKGIKTIEAPIEKVDLKTIGRIDVIVAFELIEHLFSPQDFIADIKEILMKGGLLILTCPNVQGFDIAVLKENSDQFNPEHLNYFNPKSLSLLLESNGFEVLEVSTPGKLDVDIVKNKVAQKKYTPEPFIQSLLDTGDKFQQFLVENNLSSHLWMVARKK